MDQTVTLDTLLPGERGRIVKVGGNGELRKRIIEMGIAAGKTVEVERIAPLGDPYEVLVMGSHVSLRRSEMATIRVEKLT